MQVWTFLSQAASSAAQAAAAVADIYYDRNLHTSLFTGFLALGGFLFTVKTFIVVKMKEEVYDTELYGEMVQRERRKNPEFSHYGPLARLSVLLYWVIILALATAFLQVTLGLWKHSFAVVICLGAAFLTIGLLVYALHQVKSNLLHLFEIAEERTKDGDQG